MNQSNPDFAELGFVRVAAIAPALMLADPITNGERIAGHLRALAADGVSVALFPELAMTGYSCEDLFFSSELRLQTRAGLRRVAAACRDIVAVVGAPWPLPDGRLVNCALVLADGAIIGAVPKSARPNYGEFYEQRWFVSGDGIDCIIRDPDFGTFRILSDQLFEAGALAFAIEICEDLWSPYPPGTRHCLAGAQLILNPSASNELVAKAEYRHALVRMASTRGICGYLYASSGALESTKDVVFGGHLLACENGITLAEGPRFSLEAETLVTEVDVERLQHDRARDSTFAQAPRPPAYPRVTALVDPKPLPALYRRPDPHPFVPDDEHEFDARAVEILSIQATGLARRLLAAGTRNLVIGISGGLDSTLALLVCLDALAKLEWPRDRLHALTLPGPGTSAHTLETARNLCTTAGVVLKEIDISAAVAQHLADLEHATRNDVVFENAQARERTQILFNYANKVDGIVVGTGDLSELALGWCTFNADQMANYNVNASVPKTLMGYLVRWYGQHRAEPALARVLERVLATPISPELLAPEEGADAQHTESIIGPYELHDFFLFHFLRNGSGAVKIYHLARLAFGDRYPPETLKRWLKLFFRRFFSQQFKRTTLPPGPKVGSVSLSPRGDWRMPDEAGAARILEQIDALQIDAREGAR